MPIIKQLNTFVILGLMIVFLSVFSGCSVKDEVILFGTENDETDQAETGTEETDTGASDRGDPGEETDGPEKSDMYDTILVYVCGAVNSPGVVSIPVGSRVIDALEQAGGFCEGANKVYVNLAAPVNDGEQIYFPYEGEDEETIAGQTESGSKEREDALFGVENGLVNINKADALALCTIPGIGESKALAIISYRENNGRFSAIEDIRSVSGIGDALFEKIRDYICVD